MTHEFNSSLICEVMNICCVLIGDLSSSIVHFSHFRNFVKNLVNQLQFVPSKPVLYHSNAIFFLFILAKVICISIYVVDIMLHPIHGLLQFASHALGIFKKHPLSTLNLIFFHEDPFFISDSLMKGTCQRDFFIH